MIRMSTSDTQIWFSVRAVVSHATVAVRLTVAILVVIRAKAALVVLRLRVYICAVHVHTCV